MSKVEAETSRENIRQLLIPRRKLTIGDMLGKGQLKDCKQFHSYCTLRIISIFGTPSFNEFCVSAKL